MKRTAIVGGGAAGYFLAINLKEMMPEMGVSIFERSGRVLRKVAVSGGGRCNCTNSFAGVSDLRWVYPRGHRLMKRLFNMFDYGDAYRWFESHGVPLVTQEDGCVFPASQDSSTIISCFQTAASRLGVDMHTGMTISDLSDLDEFDYIAVTTGGISSATGGRWLESAGVDIVEPVASLFSFSIADDALRRLMGTVVDGVSIMIPGTKIRSSGALLITHWGMSGPAVLRLSSYGARLLHENGYKMPLLVNWTGGSYGEAVAELRAIVRDNAEKRLSSVRPFGLPARLWSYLLGKSLGERVAVRWCDLSERDLNRLSDVLISDAYKIEGRAAFKDEFVTCGGVSLQCVDPLTLECRGRKGLYFAGEVLDIDGITGGFNFQAAWTTAYAVACGIVKGEKVKK